MTAGSEAPFPRQLPALDRDTSAFWTGGKDGRLLIARCGACGRYQHPPLPRCPACGSFDVEPTAVSGQGRVASFTINRQPWLASLTEPYVFAAVELAEQAELYVFTNIIGCAPEAVRIGMEVEVVFEPREDVWLPLFRPRETAHG